MHSMSSFYNYLCKYVYKYTHNFWKKRLGNGVGNGEGVPPPHSLPRRRLFRFPLPSRLGGLGQRRKLPQRGPKLNFIQCGCQRSHLVTRIARDHILRWRTFAMAALCDGGPSRYIFVLYIVNKRDICNATKICRHSAILTLI